MSKIYRQILAALLSLMLVTSVLGLSGCGQKGPLYMPDKQHEQKKDPAQ
ncbi:MAG TPA: hypothetical protein ENI62_03455 [Gammaproteobacteria bacterium]|nr:hypothetical protein [Gammaproteobacteria bacterium]